MQACYSEPATKKSLQCHNWQQTQSSSGAIKGLLGTDWLVRHLCKWHRLSGYLSDSWQHRVNLAAQLYSTSLKGILTACCSVQTEKESNRKKEDGEERRDGEKARSKGVGVWIQFPVIVCSGSLFQWTNISSVKLNGSVLGKMKENRMETIH